MKGQARLQKPNNGSSSAPQAGNHQGATNGHRRTNSRHNTGKDGSPPHTANTLTNRLVDLLARASGKPVVATVSSGAKYLGVLLAVDVSATASAALSVVLAKPVLVSKALINENSNSDSSLPEQLVIQSKDLIDIDFVLPREHDKAEASENAEKDKGDKEKTSKEKIAKVGDAEKKDETAEKPEALKSEPSEATPEVNLPTAAKPEHKGYKLLEILAAQPLKAGQFTHTQKQTSGQGNAPSSVAVELPKAQPVTQSQSQAQLQPSASAPAPAQAKYVPPQNFKTDSDISSGFKVRERELQRWLPDENTAELTLEDNSNGAWDQFKVNEEKFGVELTYDEHLYTTRINTSGDDYQERVKKAERLAREIEGLATTDRHVLEERGAQVDDSGMDEEDKYSGVQGDVVDTRGLELMAALRNASISNDLAAQVPTEGKYVTPRQRAAQYHNDPAIVMSSASRPAQSPPSTEPTSESTEVQSKPALIPPKPPVSQVSNASTPNAPNANAQAPQGPHGESFRLNAKSEINALKEFSANFKVPHRMPNDLLPILAKDKIKQDEIMRKLDPVKKPALPAETKKELKTFKLNPRAAAFTPSGLVSGLQSPIPPKANYARSPNNPSPRMHYQRPYSSSSSGSGGLKRPQISASDFFGGADKIPSAAKQKEKVRKFRDGFNLFATAKRNHKDESTPVPLEKPFHTPPTWDSTIDQTYQEYLLLQSQPAKNAGVMPAPGAPFMPSPLVAPGAPQMGGAAYPGTPGSFSPHMQSQASLAYQQQQYQAAMLYQFQGQMPPGQAVMYDQQFMPPGFVPGFVSPGSPNMMYGQNYQNAQGYQNGQGYHNRRYSQKPRGNS